MKATARLIVALVALVLAAMVLWPRQIEAQLNRISGTQIVGGTAKPTLLQAGDGTAAAPSYSFASDTGTGFFRTAANSLGFVTGTVVRVLFNSSTSLQLGSALPLTWPSTADASGGAADTAIGRAGPGAVSISQTATTTAELRVSGGNGGFLSSVKALTELTTIAAAATTSTAIQIPANAVVLGVSVRVVTVIPTAATFTVTSATPTKTWNTAAVAVAAGTTDPGTAPGPTFQTTASAITITPSLTPGGATGQVRVTIYYYAITPPTS